MAAGELTFRYGSTYATFNQFSGDDLPRSYLSQASLEFSALGVGYATGPVKRQKRIWSVAAYSEYQMISQLLYVFDQWDAARATGSNVAEIDIQDELFGSVVLAKGFFTDPPVVTKVASSNNRLFLVSFAVTET